jgi:hypothetical protein
MKRCVKCILHENLPGIRFNDAGVCNYCEEYEPFKEHGEEAFRAIIEPVRSFSGKYNCLVPISGGRDSSYVLYLAKKELGLNPLAVNFDNEFRNPQAVKNIENACKALDTELLVLRSKRDIATKFVQSNVRASIPMGMRTLAGSFCRQCAYGYQSVVFMTAEQKKIPLILWGSSSAESTKDMRNQMVESKVRSRYWKLLNPYLYLTEVRALQQRMEFSVPGNPTLSRSMPVLKNPDIRQISVFDYIVWDRDKIKETITTKLGWRKPEGHISSWRSDCKLHEIVNYCYVKLLGCTMDCIGYCNMIRSGQMDRETALAQEEQAVATCGDNIDNLLGDLLGLSEKEIAKIKAL